ncbi:MAG: hypothetical protein AAGJ46_09240 [Planctomycetota bacterium]
MCVVRRVAILFALIASPALGAEPAWRALLPEGWLGVVAIADPEATDAKIGRLLGDLSFDYAGGLAAFKAAVGDPTLQLNGRELVVGCAMRDGDAAAPYWFALAPLDDFDAWLNAAGGETIGEVGVVSLGGIEVCLAPCGEWVFVTSLNRIDTARVASKQAIARVPRAAPGAPTDEVVLEVSPTGIDYLAERAAQVDGRARRRVLHAGLTWPPTRRQLEAAVLQNAPLLEQWRQSLTGLRLGAELPEAGGVTLRLSSAAREPIDPQPAPASVPMLAAANTAVLVADAPSGGPLTDRLVGLYTAYDQGRPDQVDAAAFPDGLYDPFSEARRRACRGVAAWRMVFLDRSAGDRPLAACQASVMTTPDPQRTRDDIRQIISRWNDLVAGAGAKMPLVFAAETVTRGGREIDEYRVDMVTAVGVPDSVEIRAMMVRLYGEAGEYVRRVIPVGDDLLLETDAPLDEALAMAEQIERAERQPVTNAWRASIRVDRFLAWQAALRDVARGEVWGEKPERPMNDAATLNLTAAAEPDRLQLEAHADRDAVRAIGRYLRANR